MGGRGASDMRGSVRFWGGTLCDGAATAKGARRSSGLRKQAGRNFTPTHLHTERLTFASRREGRISSIEPRPPTRTDGRERAASVVVSAALHGLVFLVLLSQAAPFAEAPAPERAVQVETATSQQFDAILHPPPPLAKRELPTAPSGTPSGPTASTPAPILHPWRRATQMLSSSELADPKNKSVAPKLAGVEPKTALEQICDFEAILQIGRIETDFAPDSVVAYAMRETQTSKDLIVADGAAFRSRGRWYNLRFKCQFSARRQRVIAFEFVVGDAVPRAEWSEHALAAGSFATGEE